MATEREIISVSIDTAEADYEGRLRDAIDTEIGNTSFDDWAIVHVERGHSAATTTRYTIWLERTV